MMPKTEKETTDLKTRLANAGFRSDAAPMVYSGLRVGCLALFALFACVMFLPTSSTFFRKAQMVFIFAGIGFKFLMQMGSVSAHSYGISVSRK